jgi:hypothetical protein
LGQAAVDGRTGQSGAPATSPNRYGIGAVDRWRLYLQAAPDSPVRHETDHVHCPVRL